VSAGVGRKVTSAEYFTDAAATASRELSKTHFAGGVNSHTYTVPTDAAADDEAIAD